MCSYLQSRNCPLTKADLYWPVPASYVGLEWGDGIVTWGAGTDTDIIMAGIHALVSAINNK